MTTRTPKNVPSFSPFEVAFSDINIDEIPLSFQEQFLHAPENPYHIVLDGVLDVWFRPKWLKPLFWLSEKMGILVSETGKNIPVKLTVRAEREKDKIPVHYWDREFQFKKSRYFNTILPYDFTKKEVGDFIGKWKFVYIVWKTRFHAPDRFTLDTNECAFHVNGHYFWLPKWLWQRMFGVLHCTQKAEGIDSDKFSINLVISHPWFGDFFGYKGKFKTIRKTKNES